MYKQLKQQFMSGKKASHWIGLIVMIFLFTGCATSKQARSIKHTINGTWELQTINFQGMGGKVKAYVFNEADVNCFIGSTWNFIANNSMGTYELAFSQSCPAVKRNIRWSVYEAENEAKQLQFKRLDNGKKSMDDKDGFRLSVTAITETTMQLISAVDFEGKQVAIVYNFVKK